VTVLAKKIMDKWSRMVFGISTSYTEGNGRNGDEEEEDELGGSSASNND